MKHVLKAEAKTTSTNLLIEFNGEKLTAKPEGWDKTGVEGAVKRYSTTKYELFDTSGIHQSFVEYNGVKDSIIFEKGATTLATTTSWFSPHVFTYNKQEYHIHEKVTGVIMITRGDEIVAKGKCTFRSVIFQDYPKELEPILPELATGFLIKMVLWSMFL